MVPAVVYCLCMYVESYKIRTLLQENIVLEKVTKIHVSGQVLMCIVHIYITGTFYPTFNCSCVWALPSAQLICYNCYTLPTSSCST